MIIQSSLYICAYLMNFPQHGNSIYCVLTVFSPGIFICCNSVLISASYIHGNFCGILRTYKAVAAFHVSARAKNIKGD